MCKEVKGKGAVCILNTALGTLDVFFFIIDSEKQLNVHQKDQKKNNQPNKKTPNIHFYS